MTSIELYPRHVSFHGDLETVARDLQFPAGQETLTPCLDTDGQMKKKRTQLLLRRIYLGFQMCDPLVKPHFTISQPVCVTGVMIKGAEFLPPSLAHGLKKGKSFSVKAHPVKEKMQALSCTS